MCTLCTMLYGAHKGNTKTQVEFVSFRTDPEIKQFLKKKFRNPELARNKSLFHAKVYRAGMKAFLNAI